MVNEYEKKAVADILLEACQGPKAQMRPWRPFDFAQVAEKILETINLMRGSTHG